MSLTAISRGARELADDLDGTLIAEALGDASYAIKRDALRIAGLVTGGDRRLSRFGGGRSKGRTRMGVNYTVTGTGSVILLKPAAMWAMTADRVRPHQIGAGRRTRTGRTTRRRGRSVLVFPVERNGSRVRLGPVNHPGTRARGSLVAVYRNAPRHVADVFGDALTDRIKDWGR